MDDAQMDAADLGFIVVEQGRDPLFVAVRQVEFLVQLALHGPLVGGHVEVGLAGIAVVDVSANADRPLRVQPRLAAGLAPGVVQDAARVPDQEVGDDLFVRRVLLGRPAGQEEVVGGVEQGGQEALDVEVQALEAAQAVEQAAGNDEDVLFLVRHGAQPSPRPRLGHAEIVSTPPCAGRPVI